MARASGLKTVRFTGWISHEELQELFFSAHIGLILMRGGITPFWLGNKFAEYLSTYLALVNNVAGEAAGIVDSRRVGWNVAPKDPQAVADLLRSLLASPETVRTAMTNSRTIFNDVFERGRIYDGYVQYLSDRVTRPDAPSTE
jgi:glycosyltransferase involved in cell wall biosynthesis